MAGRRRHGIWWLMPGIATLLVLSACSRGTTTPPGAVVNLHQHDFRIDTTTSSVPAGSVTFQVHNDAPATHEFVVVRTDASASHLPLGPDGLSVDEHRLSSVGEISEVDAGTTGTLSLSLAPGRYVFFCNMEGHYLGGMHGVLEVTGDG